MVVLSFPQCYCHGWSRCPQSSICHVKPWMVRSAQKDQTSALKYRTCERKKKLKIKLSVSLTEYVIIINN